MYPLNYIEHEDHLKWEEFFNNLSYKPNWEFDYRREVDAGISKVIMTMRVPDSRRSVPETRDSFMAEITGRKLVVPLVPISKTIVLPRFFGEDHAKDFLFFSIREMEMHEVGEWFRYKGELVFDPHKGEQ